MYLLLYEERAKRAYSILCYLSSQESKYLYFIYIIFILRASGSERLFSILYISTVSCYFSIREVSCKY